MVRRDRATVGDDISSNEAELERESVQVTWVATLFLHDSIARLRAKFDGELLLDWDTRRADALEIIRIRDHSSLHILDNIMLLDLVRLHLERERVVNLFKSVGAGAVTASRR